MGKRFLQITLAISLTVLVHISYTDPQAFAQPANNATTRMDEPGGTPADILMASQHPDEYAWQLFFFLNRQAKLGAAGQPDPGKATFRDYDGDRAVVWETWGLASGLDIDFSVQPSKIIINKSEVFQFPATAPVAWEQLDRPDTQPKILSPNLKSLAIALAGAPAMTPMGLRIMIAPLGTSPAEDETRMNRSTYETIRSKRLYSVEGIQTAINVAENAGKVALVEFEPLSKETKARWIHLTSCDNDANCADRKRYHWRTVTIDGATQIWGLVSLHIITKDLPNWFWADFSHVDCEKKVGACADASEGAQTPIVDSTVPGGGTRSETVGSKWNFYVLRGTETDFNTPNGVKRILSNPVIESGFQKSSCITCHSYASGAIVGTVPKGGTSLALFTGNSGMPNIGSRSFDIGTPDCWRFYTPRNENTGTCPDNFDNKKPLYLQTDFLWSIPFRAFSEKP